MSVVCDRACRAQLLNFWSKVMLEYVLDFDGNTYI